MKQNLKKITDFLIEKKITVFLVVCLATHLTFAVMYFRYGMISPGIVNIFSIAFYLYMTFRHRNSEKAIIFTYFEVLLYTLVTEMLLRGSGCFLFVDAGIIAGLTCLIPAYTKKKILLQSTGFLVCLLAYAEKVYIPDSFMPELYEKAVMHGDTFFLLNIIITMGLVLYVTLIYDKDLEKARNELDYKSTHDALTGLYNRRYLNDYINSSEDREITVAMFDIDNFKKINDSFGHDIGDEVLSGTAELLKTDFSDSVSVRWGGEEFILFFLSGEKTLVYGEVKRICDSIQKNIHVPDGRTVTVTSGIASGTVSTFEETLKKADEYLYYGKNHGKNCIISSDEDMQ